MEKMSPTDKIKKRAEHYANNICNRRQQPELWRASMKGYERGFKEATVWSSPDEKPIRQNINFPTSKAILFIVKKSVLFGWYNYDSNIWESWADCKFLNSEIDGWQYLPEPIKK